MRQTFIYHGKVDTTGLQKLPSTPEIERAMLVLVGIDRTSEEVAWATDVLHAAADAVEEGI